MQINCCVYVIKDIDMNSGMIALELSDLHCPIDQKVIYLTWKVMASAKLSILLDLFLRWLRMMATQKSRGLITHGFCFGECLKIK